MSERVQELRVAMALNGGVSLAVWMGGCAVELDRARRAGRTSGEPERVYDTLCRSFGRRLVFDILTGASAGGINGALLGAAMVKGRRLETKFVRDQWLDLGDLGDLMYPASAEEPASLMDGKLFHERLRKAFEGVLGVNKQVPGYEDCKAPGLRRVVPSLDVTMTDVIGVEKRFRDTWGGELVAREHRPRFRFREAAHFSAESLAAAARTSASFPFAFEPWMVNENARVLAGLPNPTFGIDGGLLDNAPIEAALDLIPTKPADSRVVRYVCYMNGDPTAPSDALAGEAPSLREVGAYAVNLPRTAPFVDQLYAIKRAVERPRLSADVQLRLLKMDLGELQGTARALFGAYCERRTMTSLEELLGEPAAATAMSDLLSASRAQLPWIPFQPTHVPGTTWRWGVRPAQRVLHLLLDLLRAELPTADDALRDELLATRDAIDAQLFRLTAAREEVLEPAGDGDPARLREEPPLDRLQKAVAKAVAQAPLADAAVRAGAEAVRDLLLEFPGELAESPMRNLFGSLQATEADRLAAFFDRVLAIEVVRRAFSSEADIESAEELHFVQLTPAAPAPIFTSGPLRLPSPASAQEKLTGVGLGHFAGFYRRSWRANDFMWGRLDAAARLVDMLLARPSDECGDGKAATRAEKLTEALLPASAAEDAAETKTRRWLLEEALEDAAAARGAPLEGKLRERVEQTIRAELEAADETTGVERMPFTRAVFQRAAQLEIVSEELGIVFEEATADSALGSAVEPFAVGRRTDPQTAVKAVRKMYADGGFSARAADRQRGSGQRPRPAHDRPRRLRLALGAAHSRAAALQIPRPRPHAALGRGGDSRRAPALPGDRRARALGRGDLPHRPPARDRPRWRAAVR